MRFNDTVDKIVTGYLGPLCRRPFDYKGKIFKPKQVYVSPLIFRGYICFKNCGACCGAFSLDYLPREAKRTELEKRTVRIGARSVELFSDRQGNSGDRWCKHLDRDQGVCSIYKERPFACDFELIRVLNEANRAIVTQKLYGRYWAMARLDGERGALCEMTTPTEHSRAEVVRKLNRLQEWSDHLGVATCVADILFWAVNAPGNAPLVLDV